MGSIFSVGSAAAGNHRSSQSVLVPAILVGPVVGSTQRMSCGRELEEEEEQEQEQEERRFWRRAVR
jgi:hypothetical protein